MSRGLLIALLVVIIGALIAIPLIVVRRSGRRPAGAEASATTADVRPRLPEPAGESATAPGTKPVPEPVAEAGGDTLNGVKGQVSPSALRTIHDRVDADPAEDARVLRRWLNEDR